MRPRLTGEHIQLIGKERGTKGHHSLRGTLLTLEPLFHQQNTFSPFIPSDTILKGLNYDRYSKPAISGGTLVRQTTANDQKNRFDFGHAYALPDGDPKSHRGIVQVQGSLFVSFKRISNTTYAAAPVCFPCCGFRDVTGAAVSENTPGDADERNDCTTHFPILTNTYIVSREFEDVSGSHSDETASGHVYLDFNQTLAIERDGNRQFMLGFTIVNPSTYSSIEIDSIHAHMTYNPYEGDLKILDPMRG